MIEYSQYRKSQVVHLVSILLLGGVLLSSCESTRFEPTPFPIADNEVYLRASYNPDDGLDVFVRNANGKDVLWPGGIARRPHLYPVRLPAGMNVLDVRVTIRNLTSHGGALDDWYVELPGGREYRLVGGFVSASNIVDIWIEDAASHARVSDPRKLAIVFDRDLVL